VLENTATYIVECFWPDVKPVEVAQRAESARASAARLSRAGRSVAFAGSMFVPGDDVVFYLFEGVSSDVVGEACVDAGIAFERVVETVWEKPTRKEQS
jgi:hypothetical protein